TGLWMVVREVLPALPRLIGATVVFFLVLMLGLIPVIVGGATASIPLVAVGFLLVIVWSFYALARFFAVFQVIVLENRGIIAAFSRSSFLSQNRKGHVLLTLFLVFVIFIALYIAMSAVAPLTGSLAGSVVLQSLFT